MALTIKDALRLATKDQVFAQKLVANPASMKDQFGLSEAQVTQLKNLGAAAQKAGAAFRGVGPRASYE